MSQKAWLTSFLSFRFVNMTMVADFCSQIILQKSLTVSCLGPVCRGGAQSQTRRGSLAPVTLALGPWDRAPLRHRRADWPTGEGVRPPRPTAHTPGHPLGLGCPWGGTQQRPGGDPIRRQSRVFRWGWGLSLPVQGAPQSLGTPAPAPELHEGLCVHDRQTQTETQTGCGPTHSPSTSNPLPSSLSCPRSWR